MGPAGIFTAAISNHNKITTNQCEITFRDFEGCHQLVNLDLAHNQIAMLSGHFQGFQSLKKLNLLGNDIVCVDREALESLDNVEEIEIDLRYLQCSCANNWVRSFSQSQLFSKRN